MLNLCAAIFHKKYFYIKINHQPLLHLISSFSRKIDFFKMGQSRPLFVSFRPFLITISIIQIENSVDGVLGIWTCCHRMVEADKTTELWQPLNSFQLWFCGNGRRLWNSVWRYFFNIWTFTYFFINAKLPNGIHNLPN